MLLEITKPDLILEENKIEHVFDDQFDTLSIERKLTNEQMECMQFVFLIMLQDKLRKFPFFINNWNLF